MKLDAYGRSYFTEQEIFEELYKNPNLNIANFNLDCDQDSYKQNYNNSVQELKLDWDLLARLENLNNISVSDYHNKNQNSWLMPDSYKDLDIAQYLLDKCSTQHEKQRVSQELLLYQERELFDLLKYMKYLVDTLNSHNIVWGVGRGSSVASYVLFLLGVHKIDSLYYDLDISEFLK